MRLEFSELPAYHCGASITLEEDPTRDTAGYGY